MTTLAGTRPTPGAMPAAAVPRRHPVASTSATTQGTVEMAGSTVLFLGLLSLMLVEYIGLTKDIPILKLIRYSTLTAYTLMAIVIARVGPKALVEYPQSKALLAFVGFTGFTVIYAVVRSYVPTALRAHLDYFALYLTTLYLVDRRKRFDLLSLTCSVITILLVVRNLPKLGQEQRTAVFTAGYFMGDGNDFAWGLLTLLPFSIYLLIGKRRPIHYRLIGLAGLACGLLGVIGTQSRGAALALAAAGLFYWFKLAKRKAATAAALAIVVTGAAIVAPPTYFDRLKSIENYEEDSSAQGRLRAWKAAVNMAIDYPLGVGAGSFNSAYGRFYMPSHVEGWAPNRWISAHSVYFKVLGEYGFLGLAIVLWVIYSCMRMNLRNLARVRATPDVYSVPDTWPALIALGFVAYSVAAVFLGGITYPHLYFLAGLTVGCDRILAAEDANRERRNTEPAVEVSVSRVPTPPRATAMVPRRRPAPTAVPRKFFD